MTESAYDAAGLQARDRPTNRHTIDGARHLGDTSQIDWDAVRSEVGE